MYRGFTKQRRQPRFNEHRLKATGLRIRPPCWRRNRSQTGARGRGACPASMRWRPQTMSPTSWTVTPEDACYFAFSSLGLKAPWGCDFSAFAKAPAVCLPICDRPIYSPRCRMARWTGYLQRSASAPLMLPAEKQDGVKHVHGFFRVPNAAVRLTLSRWVTDSGRAGENNADFRAIDYWSRRASHAEIRWTRTDLVPHRPRRPATPSISSTTSSVDWRQLSYLVVERAGSAKLGSARRPSRGGCGSEQARERAKYPQLPPRRILRNACGKKSSVSATKSGI